MTEKLSFIFKVLLSKIPGAVTVVIFTLAPWAARQNVLKQFYLVLAMLLSMVL
jgi:hypothetical protein